MKICTKRNRSKSGNKNKKKSEQKSYDNQETPKEQCQSLISKLKKEFVKDRKNSLHKRCKSL
jgi:hypothetical protein